MKKILAIVLALALVLGLGAMAFAATADVAAEKIDSASEPPVTPPEGPGGGAKDEGGKPKGNLIVKFHTGEVQKGTPIDAPYTEEGKAAIELADKVVKGIEDASEELKAFFEENEGALAVGIITMGEDAAEGTVKLAVSAKGFDKVMFNAPGDAEDLGFVILEDD